MMLRNPCETGENRADLKNSVMKKYQGNGFINESSNCSTPGAVLIRFSFSFPSVFYLFIYFYISWSSAPHNENESRNRPVIFTEWVTLLSHSSVFDHQVIINTRCPCMSWRKWGQYSGRCFPRMTCWLECINDLFISVLHCTIASRLHLYPAKKKTSATHGPLYGTRISVVEDANAINFINSGKSV